MSVDIELLPDFIIFEDYNLTDDEKNEVYKWLELGKYRLYSDSGICMATKSV